MSTVSTGKAESKVVLLKGRPRALIMCQKGDFVGCFIGHANSVPDRRWCKNCPFLNTDDCTIPFYNEATDPYKPMSPQQHKDLWEQEQVTVRAKDELIFESTTVTMETIDPEACPICTAAAQELEVFMKATEIKRIVRILNHAIKSDRNFKTAATT